MTGTAVETLRFITLTVGKRVHLLRESHHEPVGDSDGFDSLEAVREYLQVTLYDWKKQWGDSWIFLLNGEPI